MLLPEKYIVARFCSEPALTKLTRRGTPSRTDEPTPDSDGRRQTPVYTGGYLRVAADESGIDVTLTLRNPNGTQIKQSNGAFCPELPTIAAKAGQYPIEVTSETNATAGRHRIVLEKHAKKWGRPESKHKALTSFAQALAMWRAIRDPYTEALTLHHINVCDREDGESFVFEDFWDIAFKY